MDAAVADVDPVAVPGTPRGDAACAQPDREGAQPALNSSRRAAGADAAAQSAIRWFASAAIQGRTPFDGAVDLRISAFFGQPAIVVATQAGCCVGERIGALCRTCWKALRAMAVPYERSCKLTCGTKRDGRAEGQGRCASDGAKARGPGAAHWKFSRVRDDGRAEAALLGRWAVNGLAMPPG